MPNEGERIPTVEDRMRGGPVFKIGRSLLLLAVLASITLVTQTALASHGATMLASSPVSDQPAYGGSGNPSGFTASAGLSITADGRYVAFASDASNLVSGDFNLKSDIFVFDHATGTTSQISRGLGDQETNGDSITPRIAAGGRYVAFWSAATNLVAGDSTPGIFVYDLLANRLERVSITQGGEAANGPVYDPTISSDGRYVAFASESSNMQGWNGVRQIFIRDRKKRTTTLVSRNPLGAPGDSYSFAPAISSNGRYVAFESWADDLVMGDRNAVGNQASYGSDVFVVDRKTGTTDRVSVSGGGVEGDGPSRRPSISGDGRYVAFDSLASNLVADDTNGTTDVFVRDRFSNMTTRVSLGPGGAQSLGGAALAAISADGGTVAFASSADDLVANDMNRALDVFVHDASGVVSLVSVSSSGWQGNRDSWFPVSSEAGRFVAFASGASNLVPGDVNNVNDVFVRDRAYDPASDSVPAQVDVTPPSTSASVEPSSNTGVTSGDWSTDGWRVSLSCSDDHSSCMETQYEINGGATQEYAGPFNLADEGRYALAFQSRDYAGNVEPTQFLSLGVDRSGSTAEITTADGSLFVSPITPVEISATASDPTLSDGSPGSGVHQVCFVFTPAGILGQAHVECGVQAGDEWSASPNLVPGTYDVVAEATDLVRNFGGDSAPIRIIVV
jgi:Tol biopolymer transport system component